MKKFNLLDSFLTHDIQDEGMYQDIAYFVKWDNYRYGEYEGNRYVVRKILGDDNVSIFPDNEPGLDQDRTLVMNKREFLRTIDKAAKKQGFTRDIHGDDAFFNSAVEN